MEKQKQTVEGEVSVVTRQNSLDAGNCVPGTDQFINKFFPNGTSATIAEIAGAVGCTDLGGAR